MLPTATRLQILLACILTGAASAQERPSAVASPRDSLRGARQAGTLVGTVLAAPDSQPVDAARVSVARHIGEVRTDARGRFGLTLRSGTYEVTVSALGYAPRTLGALRLADGDTVVVAVLLEPAPLRLDEVVVTPSTFGIRRDIVPSVLTLTRDAVRARPHFGEDIYRLVNRLPGLGSHDIKIGLHVRGSPNDQVLQTLDGIELYEPFHLKDVDGALSIIDVESVRSVDLQTGGFTAEYGDKLAGVFAMETTTPPPGRVTTTLGASLMNLTFKSEGGFAGGRGTWLASARRGYLDIILRLMRSESEIRPTYYDAFTKVQYQLGARHLIAAHVLYAGDRWFGIDDDDWTQMESRWGTGYGWLTWRATLASSLTATTMVSATHLTRARDGVDYFGERQFQSEPGEMETNVVDRGAFDTFGLKQDWSLLASDRLLVRWGFDLRRGVADYDYWGWHRQLIPNRSDPTAPDWQTVADTVIVVEHPTGREVGAYLSSRVQVVPFLTAEVGVRYDHQSHSGDHTVAPRVNAAFQLGVGTTLRAAWGLYYQSHGLQEMYVSDGDTRFFPAERAEHRILGLEHRFPSDLTVRVEAYERLIPDPRPEYRDLMPELEQFPEEGPFDRVFVDPTRGIARGIEVLLADDAADPVAWSASYALAATADEIDGVWVPSPFEQRHTVRLECSYRLGPSWMASVAWQYHSGWPTTAFHFQAFTLASGATGVQMYAGPMSGERLPPYVRLDVRLSKTFSLGRGRLSVFLDVFNLLDRANAESFDYTVYLIDSQMRVDETTSSMLGILPTIGARWKF